MATQTKNVGLYGLSTSQVAKLRKARENGATLAALADQFGINVAAVRKLNGYVPPAKRNGEPVNPASKALKGATGKGAKTVTAPKAAAKAPVRASVRAANKVNAGLAAAVKAESKAKPAKPVGSKRHQAEAAKTPATPPAKAEGGKRIGVAGVHEARQAKRANRAKGVGVADIAVVKAAELHRLLSDVQPFAGNDDTLPMLTATHIEWNGKDKRFLAVTTDRFTLGISKLDVPDSGVTGYGVEDVYFMLEAKDVAALLRIAKTARKDVDWRLVTISRVGEIPAGATVPTFTFRFAFFSGEQLTVKPFDVEFPKFRQLLPTGEPVARCLTALNVHYLAKFAKVANESQRIRFYSFDDSETGGVRPTAVLIGENFVGLIMPVRLGDESEAAWRKPSWVA
jgi:DNA polymerase III beta subunit, central domain